MEKAEFFILDFLYARAIASYIGSGCNTISADGHGPCAICTPQPVTLK
jgi:hypothetical protein